MAACSAARRAARADCSAAVAVGRGAGGLGRGGAGGVEGGGGGLAGVADLGEAVLLLQAEGGGGGGAAGGDGEAVPAPEVALRGDEALAGAEERLQAGAVGAGDDADGGEAAGELGRGLDLRGERSGACGQGGGGVEGRQRPPAGCAGG